MARLKFIDSNGNVQYLSVQGMAGPKGEDAISIIVTSSNGTLFQDSAVFTILTAHVFQNGRELSEAEISELGTIKWYKNRILSSVGSGLSLTINEILDKKAVYTASLEENEE